MTLTNKYYSNRDTQPRANYLSNRDLNSWERDFFEAWRVTRAGILVPQDNGPDMRVWAGRFVDGLTVTIVAPDRTKISATEGQLKVGTVTEDDRMAYENAGFEIPEADVRAAQISVRGLREAVTILHKIAHFPID